MKKVIIWGHKLGSHTHSFVHFGYYRAAKFLGYDTYWMDDNDDVSNFDFSNSIFITDSSNPISEKIPIRKDCIYFDHFSDTPFQLTGNCYYRDKFKQSRLDHPNYYNFLYYAETWNKDNKKEWPDDSELQLVGEKHFFHQKSKTLTTMWATDLLPPEIDKIEPCLFDNQKEKIYFVGTIQGQNLLKFAEICKSNNKQMVNAGGWIFIHNKLDLDVNQNIELVRDSFISVDIREQHSHLFLGKYYPCRIFKNISYGKWTGSNHKGIEDVFFDNITCENNLEILYHKLVEDYKKCDYSKMKSAMNFVKDKHTYVNRINDMFKILK